MRRAFRLSLCALVVAVGGACGGGADPARTAPADEATPVSATGDPGVDGVRVQDHVSITVADA